MPPSAELRRDPARRPATLTGALASLTGQRVFAPNLTEIVTSHDDTRWALYDGLVGLQGANYALAKRIQRWRCLLLADAGRAASFNVAPAAYTHSVTDHPAFAAALLRPLLTAFDRGLGRLAVVYDTVLGAVLPSNSPGVHTLWLPAIPPMLATTGISTARATIFSNASSNLPITQAAAELTREQGFYDVPPSDNDPTGILSRGGLDRVAEDVDGDDGGDPPSGKAVDGGTAGAVGKRVAARRSFLIR